VERLPRRGVSGTCRTFTCKYHAWRYELDGKLAFVQQEGEFFNLGKGQYGLKKVRCEYLEDYPLGQPIPGPRRNLLLLMMSLVLVSFPVEVWQQPRVPDGGATYLDLVVEPKF